MVAIQLEYYWIFRYRPLVSEGTRRVAKKSWQKTRTKLYRIPSPMRCEMEWVIGFICYHLAGTMQSKGTVKIRIKIHPGSRTFRFSLAFPPTSDVNRPLLMRIVCACAICTLLWWVYIGAAKQMK